MSNHLKRLLALALALLLAVPALPALGLAEEAMGIEGAASVDASDDLCVATVSWSAIGGADEYEVELKGKAGKTPKGSWSTKKTVNAGSGKTVSTSITVQKGEKITYSVRAHNKSRNVYSKWASKNASLMPKDPVKKSVSSALKKSSDENSIASQFYNYRVSLIDYQYDAAKDRTTLTTKTTLYFLHCPMNWDGELITAIDNLDSSDSPFRFVENGSGGTVTFSKWKEPGFYKQKKLKVAVGDDIDNACVATYQGALGSGADNRTSFVTYTAKWSAKGKVTEFRVKGTALVYSQGMNSDASYSFSSSGQSLTIKTSPTSGIIKGKWASISCEM